MSLVCNHRGSSLDFFEAYVGSGGDVDKDAGSTGDGCFEKRAGHGSLSRNLSLVSARAFANAHVSIACIAHNGRNIRKVKVYKTGDIDKVGNALHAVTENIVRILECIYESNSVFGNLLESLIRDYNERVYIIAELNDTRFSLYHALSAFKCERLRNDTDSEDAHFLCHLGNNGSRTCACTAAHADRDEHHIRATYYIGDFLEAFLSSLLAYCGVGTCAVTLCNLFTDGNLCGST